MSLIPDIIIDRVKEWEGLRLKAYKCPGDVWTIGYGHTRGVTAGMTCTAAEAMQWLLSDLDEASGYVDRYVTVPLSVNQRGALTSFVFNLGAGTFRKSSLLTELNKGNYSGASSKFGLYVKSGGVVLSGLVKRRAEERAIFDSTVTSVSPLIRYSTTRLSAQESQTARRLQELLASLSLYSGVIDGIPGDKTSAGIAKLLGYRLHGDPKGEKL